MAKHYTPLKRLAERSGRTPEQLLATCSQLGVMVNTWSGRNDLAVYGGEDAASNEAIAAFYHDSAEIEVNLIKAFGEATTSEMIGNLLERATQFENPNVVGVIYHEALHAKHTVWDKEYLSENLDNAQGKAFMLLEEIRIETRGVLENPNNRLFLRASAMTFALEGVSEGVLEDVSEIWQSATLAVLGMGRYDAGVLEAQDVLEINDHLVRVLGSELLEKLRGICGKFMVLKGSQILAGIELAKEWVELLRQADPEGEGSFGSASEEGEAGEVGILAEMLEEIAEGVEASNARALDTQEKVEKLQEGAKAREAEGLDKAKKRQDSKRIFDKSNDSAGSGSRSTLDSERLPNGSERSAAVAIASMLEKAKYRERSVHEISSHLPYGKLKPRAMIQNAALAARGSMDRVPAWGRKVRKHTDDPTLRLGVMVDISGSMGSAMEAMATTAWVIGEAGRRIQAKTAMVYYGSGVFPTLRVGQRLDRVRVFTAPDGTEEFDQAYDAIDGELSLNYGDGVRILVIVSDGQYRQDQRLAVNKSLLECKRNGVAVLWITPKQCNGSEAARLITQAGWGVHLDGLNVDEIALSVGKAASTALGRVASLT